MNSSSNQNEIDEVEALVIKLTSKLLPEFTASSISETEKLPIKAKLLREALLFRIIDLSECALQLYKNKKLIPSFILIRATFETVALFYDLINRINRAVENNLIGDIDDFLMKAITGSRLKDLTNQIPYKSVNVMTLIDKISETMPSFGENYDILCEFAHPNAFGTIKSYTKSFKDERRIELGFDKHNIPEKSGILSLRANLLTFELCMNKFDEKYPLFIKLCKEDLNRK